MVAFNFETVYVAHSIGTWEALDLRVCRDKDGRQQRQVEILLAKGNDSHRCKPKWIDQALVFKTEEEAKAALRWARTHRDRHHIKQTLPHILIHIDYMASLALSAEPAKEDQP